MVNVLVSSVINIRTLGTNTLKFDLRPSNSKEPVKGSIMVSLTTDMSAGGMSSTPLRSSPSMPVAAIAQAGPSSPSPYQQPQHVDMNSMVQNKLNQSQAAQQVQFDEFGPLPPGYAIVYDSGVNLEIVG